MGQRGAQIKILAVYASLIIITLITLTFIMQLWRSDIHIPFQYGGDTNMTAEWVKALLDNGWYLDNRYIGMPTGNNLRDVPQTDNFHYLIIKLISFFTNDYAAILNIFFILTFPLIVCTSFYVFRKFSISPHLSFIGAFLYAFLPYHYFRNIGHIFLSAYYMNPLIIMVILWLFSGQLDTIKEAGSFRRIIGSIKPKFIGSLAICCIIAAGHVYYAYFACFFLLIAGSVRSFWQKSFRPATTAIILTGVITVSGLLTLSPVILYQLQHGQNKAASVRVYHESELYSLKISELLLPTIGHRIKFLSDLRDKHEREISFLYRFYRPKIGSSIGIIGSAGFIFLLIFLLVYRKSDENDSSKDYTLLHHLSILNITALLLSITGGFNSFVSHILRYKIRGYERMNNFIAFFSIFVILILIQKFYERYICNKQTQPIRIGSVNLRPQRITYYIVIFLILAAGLYDQAGKGSTPEYDSVKKKYMHDKQFVGRIEQVLPPGSMVFQLPYVSYPETKFPYKMIDYDHFRCYLHSKTLRWSYGTVKGRTGDKWQKNVSSKQTAALLKEISDKGFKGIYVDRNGYEDNGEKIISEIKAILKTEPITSDDKTMVFFKMNHPLRT